MPFSLPSLPEIPYRLWRLRRLIALAALLPWLAFGLMGLIGWNGLAGSTGGLALIGGVLLVVIGTHATLFPNSNDETLTISLLLTAFALFMAAFGGSVLARILFAVFALWFMLSGPGRVLVWQTASRHHKPVLTAKIRVGSDLKAARAWFPLRPELERGQYRCGPVGEDGAFPVWYDMPVVDVFHGLDLPEPPGLEEQEAFFEKVALDPEDEAYEINKALHDDYLAEHVDPDAPSFWAEIQTDEPEYQKTRLFTRSAGGNEETLSTVEHRFKRTKAGCVVTESDTPESYPMGQTLGIWLSDFQHDGLIYLRDLLEGRESRALKQVHRWSIMTLLARWFIGRKIRQASQT